MKRTRWFLVCGVVGVAALATGCKDDSVRTYLSAGGPMQTWQNTLSKAVCQLEVRDQGGLNPAKRICPNGEGGPGDKTPPPVYPR